MQKQKGGQRPPFQTRIGFCLVRHIAFNAFEIEFHAGQTVITDRADIDKADLGFSVSAPVAIVIASAALARIVFMFIRFPPC